MTLFTNSTRIAVILAAMMVTLVGPLVGAAPREQEVDETLAARVRAAYLYKLMKYIRWPEEVHQGEDAPIMIGVLGEGPFGAILDRTVQSKTVGSRTISTRRLDAPSRQRPADPREMERLIEEIDSCHLLYFCPSEAGSYQEVLEHLQSTSVLTVSDIESFARHGGMIELVLQEKSIVLHINRTIVEASDLRMSSKLLSLATIVETETD